jgi:hypothetical protein
MNKVNDYSKLPLLAGRVTLTAILVGRNEEQVTLK